MNIFCRFKKCLPIILHIHKNSVETKDIVEMSLVETYAYKLN